MIHYAVPYDLNANIGQAYNATLDMLPSNDDFACLMDGDTIFTTSRYGSQIHNAVHANPSCGLFYARTNRIGCPWQLDNTHYECDDIKIHRKHGSTLARMFGHDVRPVDQEEVPGSGFLILVRKSLWRDAGGFKETGLLGVDWDFFCKVQKLGQPILLMLGVYLYHWYRGGKQSDKSHLFKKLY